ncbi:MAG: glycosyltransferase family 39 protein, partial [Deltaproteobacteria bacterium]|nr:glycosyltransferase family 39 protein [Deltaproteobacteria bacterium]
MRNQPALVSVCLSWGLVAVTVFYVLAARVRLLDIPLERDEGEYAYAGQLLLDGVLPYQHVYNMKMPGIYALYALLLKVLGTSCSAIHLGLLAVNVAAVLMLFFIGRRLCGRLGGAVAAACFAALSVSQTVQGVFANAEHFVLVFALAGVLVLLRAIDKRRMRDYGLSGLFFGAAFLTKQHGFAFGLFGWMLLLTTLARRPFARQRVIMVFACGMLLPFVLCCTIFYAAGLFDEFWFWTFSYGRSYGALVPFDSGLQMFQERFAAIVRPSLWIWGLAGVGLCACFLNRSLQGRRLPLIGFTVCAFISVCPGFFFRPHYFIMLLPAVALLVGCAAGWGRQLLSLRFSEIYCDLGPIIIVAVALAAWGAAEYDYLYVQAPRQVLRSTYGSNPFPESPEIARYIRTHSAEDDRI